MSEKDPLTTTVERQLSWNCFDTTCHPIESFWCVENRKVEKNNSWLDAELWAYFKDSLVQLNFMFFIFACVEKGAFWVHLPGDDTLPVLLLLSCESFGFGGGCGWGHVTRRRRTNTSVALSFKGFLTVQCVAVEATVSGCQAFQT